MSCRSGLLLGFGLLCCLSAVLADVRYSICLCFADVCCFFASCLCVCVVLGGGGSA